MLYKSSQNFELSQICKSFTVNEDFLKFCHKNFACLQVKRETFKNGSWIRYSLKFAISDLRLMQSNLSKVVDWHLFFVIKNSSYIMHGLGCIHLITSLYNSNSGRLQSGIFRHQYNNPLSISIVFSQFSLLSSLCHLNEDRINFVANVNVVESPKQCANAAMFLDQK